MKYDHAVVYGGKFYRAGEEVPMPIKEEAKKEVKEEVKEEVKKKSKKAASVETEKDTNTTKAKEEAIKEKEEANN